MPLAYTIHADSAEACAAALDRLCTALGLSPTLAPVRQPGAERWIARASAQPAQHEAPPDEPGGASVRWPNRPSR